MEKWETVRSFAGITGVESVDGWYQQRCTEKLFEMINEDLVTFCSSNNNTGSLE
jgi:hypothetical protein